MSNKMKQIQMSRFGAADVLTLVETDIPAPQAGEIIVKVEAIGVNYADILRRRNQYFQATNLPYVLGSEAVGRIVSVGEGVLEPYVEGVMVLAILPSGGGYAEYVAAKALYCVPLPPSIEPATATAIFVQGSTAQLLVSHLATDLNRKTVLINAAAGGVGSLLVQLAKMHGARVIGACGSEAKCAIAASLGADATVNYSKPNWHEAVKAANNGNGVDVVFEMVGGDVYNESIKSLAQGGQLIIYGAASGVQGQIHPEYFVDENITQSGFNLAYFIGHKMPLWQEALGTIIGLIAQHKLRIETTCQFALRDAAHAHRQIESRQTSGKVVLIP